jgi:SAM-dependent methyltransferase
MSTTAEKLDSDWSDRLAEMEDWYRDLLRQGEESAYSVLEHDYQPNARFLSALKGSVIDVGGGAGFTARYLSQADRYVVVDPAAVWADAGWRDFGRSFRTDLATEYVRGVGENLPFADESFDAALAFWSLNHARHPNCCLAEMARVLRPGGRALLVLEDMEPSWRDILLFCVRRLRRLSLKHWPYQEEFKAEVQSLRALAAVKLRGHWPLQSDHIRIEERDLRSWLHECFKINRREWRRGFLTFELARR